MQLRSRAEWANRPLCHAPSGVMKASRMQPALGSVVKTAGDRIAVNDILTGGQHRTP